VLDAPKAPKGLVELDGRLEEAPNGEEGLERVIGGGNEVAPKAGVCVSALDPQGDEAACGVWKE